MPALFQGIEDRRQSLAASRPPGVRLPGGRRLPTVRHQPGKELDGCRGADDSLVILSTRLHPLGDSVRGRAQLGDLQGFAAASRLPQSTPR